jgi:gamma-D-glutamyl-L-lysine dipeptidyl-peptidase
MQQYAVCQVSLAPLRSSPAEKSEMISQLLFGETVIVNESKDSWVQVTCTWDGVTGWADGKQLRRITDAEYNTYNAEQAMSLSLVEGLMAADHFIPLTLGAVLPGYDGLRCHLGAQSFQFSGSVITPSKQTTTGDWIVKVAKRYLHAPYLWGGRSPFGIDAAGLVQMVFKMSGMQLLREPLHQVTQGRSIDFTEQCQAGDLAFFDNGKGDINHVGIVLPGCHLIHASGKVRIDKLDHFGIFNKEINRYTHQLRIIKRLIPDVEPGTNDTEEPSNEDQLGGLVSQAALF